MIFLDIFWDFEGARDLRKVGRSGNMGKSVRETMLVKKRGAYWLVILP
jgi:hypothetical protein